MTTTATGRVRPEDEPTRSFPEATETVPIGVGVRLLARRVHFMAGILVAPFLAVLCLTGILFAVTPQLNDLFYPNEMFAGTPGGPARPVSEQVAAALAGHPDATLLQVKPAAEAGRNTAVVLSAPGVDPGKDLTVYVDPYTNGVRGELVTVVHETPLQVWLRTLHSSLHLGEPGRLYSEVVASWLPLLIAGGFVLWLSHLRRAGRLRSALRPSIWRGRGHRRTRIRGVHAPLGVWLSIGLLALTVTGLTWSRYAGVTVDSLQTALDGRRPTLAAPAMPVPDGATPIGIDRALEIAGAEGLSDPLTVTPPAEPGEQYKVAETSNSLPVHRDAIAIDPFTGRVTERVNWADWPLLAQLTWLGIQAHSGFLLGWVNQIALLLLAIGTLVALALGYRMWWHRRPIGRRTAPTPPPVWRRLPHHVVFLIVLAMAALGWAMPVFGMSLVAFVMLDALVGYARRRRRVRD